MHGTCLTLGQAPRHSCHVLLPTRQTVVTTALQAEAMNHGSIGFELSVIGVADGVRVRIAEVGERCVASVRVGPQATTGLGATAREALVAALSPFGARTSTAVMAAPGMFGVSLQLLRAGMTG